MSQEISEPASMNDHERVQVDPCEQPGADSNHGELKSKRPSSLEQVSGSHASKRVRKETGATDEIEAAIWESKLRQENEQLKQELNFGKLQILDLIEKYERKLYTQQRDYEAQLDALKEKISVFEGRENERKADKTQTGIQRPNKSIPGDPSGVKANVVSEKQDVWTRMESGCLRGFLSKRPDLDDESVIKLTTLQDEEDSAESSDDGGLSLELYGVDTEDMDVDEYSSFTYLRKIFRWVEEKAAKDDDERDKKDECLDTLSLCMEHVKDIPEPQADPELKFVRDIIRSFDSADKLLAQNPQKKLVKFSAQKTSQVKRSLQILKDEFTNKFSVHFGEKTKIVQACRKMGEPETTCSFDKFVQYVKLLDKYMEAFWLRRECARIVSETERAFNIVGRVEKVVGG